MAESQTVEQVDSAQEMLRVVGDILEVGVLAIDGQMRITAWNRWLESASGIAGAAMIGHPLGELVPDLLKPTGLAAFSRALTGATEIHSHRLHQYLLRLPAPADYPVFAHMQQSARVTPLFDAGKKVVGAVAFIEDVTERVANEDELRAATRLAQTANQAKSDFLAAMSHELRTPIGAISGYADLLIEGIVGPVTEEQREKLVRVKAVGDHLLKIVDEILTFARLEAKREPALMQELNAGHVMHEAASAVEPLARKKGLDFVVRAPEQKVILRTDETKLRQILINLLGNAVKFTSKGAIRMELALAHGGSAATFSVSDTGSGITPEDLERIFEPFVQARGSFSRSHEGTGLGLSVSRQLARLLGGDITVSSTVGQGSTFVVTIPNGES